MGQTLFAPSGTLGSSTTANVGIGASNPSARLQIKGSDTYDAVLRLTNSGTTGGDWSLISTNAHWTAGGNKLLISYKAPGTTTTKFSIDSLGSVGIGTAYPETRLFVEGGAVTLHNPTDSPFGYNIDMDIAGGWAREYSFSYGGTGKLFSFGVFATSGTLYYGYIGGNTTTGTVHPHPWMAFLPSGNVLIGKTAQTNAAYKLDVNGNVRANKVVVNTTGADFVFDPGYALPSLDSLNGYIQTYRHLPDVSPAETMQREGLDVGDNQIKLLQKVEELTLYVIDLYKQQQLQNKEIAALKKENLALKQQLQIKCLNRKQTFPNR
ncbi:hypothetical protein GCM10023143_25410 [Compostibacter hankyongensis]|uniref:Peptidase S74 domain-containing protein n=2 Tax=Compostibacter hankyongensis TaxID=1007089 RepID=A0ABP8G014_9BACT